MLLPIDKNCSCLNPSCHVSTVIPTLSHAHYTSVKHCHASHITRELLSILVGKLWECITFKEHQRTYGTMSVSREAQQMWRSRKNSFAMQLSVQQEAMSVAVRD